MQLAETNQVLPSPTEIPNTFKLRELKHRERKKMKPFPSRNKELHSINWKDLDLTEVDEDFFEHIEFSRFAEIEDRTCNLLSDSTGEVFSKV